MRIDGISLKIIPDSRGEDTLSAIFNSGDISVSADVPSGKSRGSHEAFVLDPEEAVAKFESIKAKIISVSTRIENQKAFDDFLIALDGTPDKSNIGGNLILALSLAWARLKAKSGNRELYEYIRSIYNRPVAAGHFPLPIMNVINGGAHSSNKLDFQEFQIIPQAFTFEKAAKLREKYGAENISLGDEAGFSAPFENNEETLDLLSFLIKENNSVLRLGLDMAASRYFRKNQNENIKNQNYYLLNKKEYSADELREYYLKLAKKYKFISLEDPFDEESFDDFAAFTARINADNISINQQYQHESASEVLIIADDLTTTNPERLKTAIEKKAGNAILVKPNQVGTLSETIGVCRMAADAGWKTVVSHRSGETEDDFIADLAYGVGAWGMKAGAPATQYRLAKYERLLKIASLAS
ncbi:MAG: phosphopyruvate hydratase [Candidatus Wolfebacteria bacterium]|nr:phosphopyruvate hydratase [Candidatus Wolfebacteria bacterium]